MMTISTKRLVLQLWEAVDLQMGSAKITLRDVAQRAQVHYGTASTVLNGAKGSTRVSEETCQRVLSAAEELGYKVNRAAQQLKTQRSRVVGLLTGDLENPFFAHMVSLCSEELEKQGYDIVLTTRRRDEGSDLHLLQSLLSRDLAGVLIWSETPTEVYEQVQRRGMNSVVVMGMNIPGYDSVAGLLENGVRSALDHLWKQGYRRIGYFAPARMLNRLGDPREQIYRDKMGEFRLQERIFSYEGTAFDVSAARTAAEALADGMSQKAVDERPDALFCFNDMNAFGAMVGLRRKGLRVPDDIALVGCDNLPISLDLDVPLTTINYPLKEVCCRAVSLLLGRIREDYEALPAVPRHIELLETELVVRESS